MKEDTKLDTKQAVEGSGSSPSSGQSGTSQPREAGAKGSASQLQTDETFDLTVGTASARFDDPTRRRDNVRLVVTIGLLSILAVVVVWSCIETASWPDHWEHTKEMLQIILPALTGLIGSVLGFYFGKSSEESPK